MNLPNFEMIHKKVIEKLKERSDSTVLFEHNGIEITNAFLDETGRFEVEPIEYYGEKAIRAVIKEVQKDLG